MKLEAETIDELLTATGDREADLRELDQLIVDTAPGLSRRLFASASITMIGYGETPGEQRTAPGWWPLIGLTVQKHHIALYVSAFHDGKSVAEHYRDRLGTTSNGKSCIRFRRLEVVDRDELANAIRDAVRWNEAAG